MSCSHNNPLSLAHTGTRPNNSTIQATFLQISKQIAIYALSTDEFKKSKKNIQNTLHLYILKTQEVK